MVNGQPLGDHPALGYAHHRRPGEAQGVHGRGEIRSHLPGGEVRRQLPPPAEDENGEIPRKLPVEQREGEGHAPDGFETVPHTGQHHKRPFAGAEADIVHLARGQPQAAVFRMEHERHPFPPFFLPP